MFWCNEPSATFHNELTGCILISVSFKISSLFGKDRSLNHRSEEAISVKSALIHTLSHNKRALRALQGEVAFVTRFWKMTINSLPLCLSPLCLQPNELTALLPRSSIEAFSRRDRCLLKKKENSFSWLKREGKIWSFRINWNAICKDSQAEVLLLFPDS